MNLIERIRQRVKERERKRIIKRRRRIRSIVAEMRKETNYGRLRRLLFEFPGVERVAVESGGFQTSYCEVRLRSGHEFIGRDYFVSSAIRNCAAAVAWYLRTELFT